MGRTPRLGNHCFKVFCNAAVVHGCSEIQALSCHKSDCRSKHDDTSKESELSHCVLGVLHSETNTNIIFK